MWRYINQRGTGLRYESAKANHPETSTMGIAVAKHETAMAALTSSGIWQSIRQQGKRAGHPLRNAERYLKRQWHCGQGIETLIAERVKFYADKTDGSKSPLDILLNRSAIRALNNGGNDNDD